MTAAQTLELANDALARARWTEARDRFRQAVAEDSSPEAWEGLGFAAYWLDDGPLTFEARLEAFRLYRQRGDVRGAARVAVRLSEDYLLFRGEPAVSNGWILRAERLLQGVEPGPEHVWLLFFKAHYALDVDLDEARTFADEARDLAHELGLFDLEMLAIAVGGAARVLAGIVQEGMSSLDEATAAATAGEITDLEIIPWTCCYLVSVCDSVRDYERAAQWCEVVREVAGRWSMRPFSAVCLAQYGGFLVTAGRWSEAEAELSAAQELALASRPAMISECVVRLAELRRRQGRAEEAAELLKDFKSEAGAIVVLAEIALDRGDPRDALTLAERSLRLLPASGRAGRAGALEVIARAAVTAGDLRRAVEAAAELADLRDVFGTTPLRASQLIAEGAAARCAGDWPAALAAYEHAIVLFGQADMPYELARAHYELAAVLRAVDEPTLAVQEEQRGHAAFAALGLEAAQQQKAPLSRREVEVFRLIAEGKTDRQVAQSLSISEHTVHRHVSNVLSKLGLSSRSAAVAWAARAGIL